MSQGDGTKTITGTDGVAVSTTKRDGDSVRLVVQVDEGTLREILLEMKQQTLLLNLIHSALT